MKQEKIQLTPEEELQTIIDKAKKKHGRVYKTILADEVIIWRMLKRSEYKEIMNLVAYREEFAVDENGEEISQEMVIARALDEITNMKILSRIEGDETKVSKEFLNDLRETIKKELNKISQKEYSGTKGKEGAEYAVSLAKLKEMIARLGSGYTSFWS